MKPGPRDGSLVITYNSLRWTTKERTFIWQVDDVAPKQLKIPTLSDSDDEAGDIMLSRLTADVVCRAIERDAANLAHPVVIAWIRRNQGMIRLRKKFNVHGRFYRIAGDFSKAGLEEERLRRISEALLNPSNHARDDADIAAADRFQELKLAAAPYWAAWWEHRNQGVSQRRKAVEQVKPAGPQPKEIDAPPEEMDDNRVSAKPHWKTWFDRFEKYRSNNRQPEKALSFVVYFVISNQTGLNIETLMSQVSRGKSRIRKTANR